MHALHGSLIKFIIFCLFNNKLTFTQQSSGHFLSFDRLGPPDLFHCATRLIFIANSLKHPSRPQRPHSLLTCVKVSRDTRRVFQSHVTLFLGIHSCLQRHVFPDCQLLSLQFRNSLSYFGLFSLSLLTDSSAHGQLHTTYSTLLPF